MQLGDPTGGPPHAIKGEGKGTFWGKQTPKSASASLVLCKSVQEERFLVQEAKGRGKVRTIELFQFQQEPKIVDRKFGRSEGVDLPIRQP